MNVELYFQFTQKQFTNFNFALQATAKAIFLLLRLAHRQPDRLTLFYIFQSNERKDTQVLQIATNEMLHKLRL